MCKTPSGAWLALSKRSVEFFEGIFPSCSHPSCSCLSFEDRDRHVLSIYMQAHACMLVIEISVHVEAASLSHKGLPNFDNV